MNSRRETKAAVRDFLAVTMICVAVAAAGAQTTWYVCWDGSGDFQTIQEGIDAASDGDVVEVCDGAYTGDGNRDMNFGGKLITVRSQNGPANCIIDCDASESDMHRAFDFQSGETAEAVLEGFTIQNGYMTWGGAIRCANASTPTIRACAFRNDTAAGNGAAESGRGGAIFCTGEAGATILSCTFENNVADSGTATFTGQGGAICGFQSTDLVVRESTFHDNRAIANSESSGGGGAIWFAESAGGLELTKCVFVGNAAIGGPHPLAGIGGALTVGNVDNLTVVDCTFVANRADGTYRFRANGWAGALYVQATDGSVLNCRFVGNVADGGDNWYGASWAAAALQAGGSITWANCEFVGNWTENRGGALLLRSHQSMGQLRADLINCTLVGNQAEEQGGGLWIDTFDSVVLPADVVAKNCVLWANEAPLGPAAYVECTNGNPAMLEVRFSDVEAGAQGIHVGSCSELIWGSGNINADPLFVGGPSGTWTAAATFEPADYQTTFHDDDAGWEDDSLKGTFLNPDTSQYLQSLVVANTATTVTVWGDFAALGTTGASYQVNDLHLQSDSPCIDAGDNTAVPADAWDLDDDGDVTERIPVDLDWRPRFAEHQGTTDTGIKELPDYPYVVDMGAYEYQCTGDLDGNGEIGLADLAQLLANYGTTTGMSYEDGDLDFDGDVDLSDLASLLALYGTTCE